MEKRYPVRLAGQSIGITNVAEQWEQTKTISRKLEKHDYTPGKRRKGYCVLDPQEQHKNARSRHQVVMGALGVISVEDSCGRRRESTVS